jgi:hypothetical protein
MIYICSKGKSANREFWGRNYDPMDSSKKVVACIYCDREVRKARAGKHIIPQAIGGRLTITDVCKGRGVCNSCNSGVLSELDNELCRRSFLSIIAAQELDKSLWLTWDVDHSAGNLLLEAKPDFDRHSMTLFPQMIFESSGPQLRGDHEELQRFAFEDFQKVFVRFMLEAFYEFKAGKRSAALNKKKLNQTTGFRIATATHPEYLLAGQSNNSRVECHSNFNTWTRPKRDSHYPSLKNGTGQKHSANLKFELGPSYQQFVAFSTKARSCGP